MTEKEKEDHPESETTKGYLHERQEGEVQMWWDSLPDKDKQAVMELPNFDADIFKQCTGIEIGKL